MSFYECGLGDRLIDRSLFPREIIAFLEAEVGLLDRAEPRVHAVVEVGCMHGRYLDWSIKNGKPYMGLDVVSRYIDQGRKRATELGLSSEVCRFILGGAENVDELIPPEMSHHSRGALLVLPFNSLGNMRACEPVVSSIMKTQLPFLISTYQTTPLSTECRRQYYRACSYEGLVDIHDGRGVFFVSDQGFCSVAYHPDFLLDVFGATGLPVENTRFSDIGMAYHTPGIFG